MAKPGFEDRMRKLEEIVLALEDGELSLEEAVERYERGVGLLGELRGHLDAMEKKIEIMTAEGETRSFAPDGEEAER